MQEITEEMIEGLKEDPSKISDYDPDVQEKIMRTLDSGGEFDFGTSSEAEGTVKEPEKTPEKIEPLAKPEEKPEWQRIKEDNAREVESYRVKAEKAKSRQEQFDQNYQESIKDMKIEAPDDTYDENFMEDYKGLKKMVLETQKENKLLRQELFSRDDEDFQDATDKSNKAKQKGVFAEIGQLQTEYGDQLKTETPVEKLNADYSGYLDLLVKQAGLNEEKYKDMPTEEKRDLAYDMFEKDPVFRKSATDAGVELPKSLQNETDFKKYEYLMDLHSQKQKDGGSLKGNFLERLSNEGKLDEAITKIKKEAAIEASNKTIDSLKEPKISEPDTSDGHGADYSKPSGEITQESMAQRINYLAEQVQIRRLTPEEEQEQNKYLAILNGEKPLG